MSGDFRLATLTLSNFKGFGEKQVINCDADLVLVVGANGIGKTSIVEALELITTGSIAQRVGDANEFAPAHFVNRAAPDRRATVTASWVGKEGQDEVVINGQADAWPERREPHGPWASYFQEAGWGRPARTNFLRSTTFLYADALGALLGPNLKAREQFLNSYLPEDRRLNALGSKVDGLRAQVGRAVREVNAGLPDVDAMKRAENAAAKNADQCAASALGKNAPLFTKANGDLYGETRLNKELESIARDLQVDVKTQPIPTRLSVLADAARRRAREARAPLPSAAPEAPLPGRELGNITQILGALRREAGLAVPGRPQLDRQLEKLEPLDVLQAKEEKARRGAAALDEERKLLWRESREGELPPGRTAIGTVPLLASLAQIEAGAPLPEWWREAGLPPPEPVRFRSLLERELDRWRSLGAARDSEASQARQLRAQVDERRRLESLRLRVQELEEAWPRAFAGESLPSREDGTLDLLGLQEVLQREESLSGAMSIAPADDGHRWDDLASAFDAWAKARAEHAEANEQCERSGSRKTVAADLKILDGVLEKLMSNKRSGNDLSARLRARVIAERFGDKINEVMKVVLGAYAHRRGLTDAAGARFDNQGHFQIMVGEPGRETGISSLSRSQLTSISVALSLTAALAFEQPGVGFTCLDDVSDALDVANLTADACLLRMLAYGDPGTRRQMILTNHNSELTDSLLPLLLPPAGRKMRVIELRAGSTKDDVSIKQWRVQGEHERASAEPSSKRESPMRDIYPARSTG